MKKQIVHHLLLGLAFLLLTFPLTAQISENKTENKHEFGIQILSILNNPTHVHLSYKQKFHDNYFNGINYKYHLTPNAALRFSYSRRKNNPKSIMDHSDSTFEFREHAFQIGVQRYLNQGNYRFYGSLNIHYRLGNEQKEWSKKEVGSNFSTQYIRNTYSYGLSPSIGLEIIITENLFFNLETSYDFFMERTETRGQIEENNNTKEIYSNENVFYKQHTPISTLNVSFRF